MANARPIYRSSSGLRKLCAIALILLVGLTLWELVDLVLHFAKAVDKFRYAEPLFPFKSRFFTSGFFYFGILNLGISLLALVAYLLWLRRCIINLQAIGIETHSDGKWALFPFILPPLFLILPIIMLRELINKNDQVYRLLGKAVSLSRGKPRSNRFLQRLANFWWTSLISSRLLIFFGFAAWMESGLYGNIKGGDLSFFVCFYLLLFIGPIVIFLFLLWQIGKLENAVGEIHSQGKIAHYRKQHLRGGRLIVKQGEIPEWYEDSNDLENDGEEESVFVDQ